MELAVDAVIKNKMGYKKASTSYSVPRATLQRYVKKKLQNESAVVDKSVGKIRPVFTADQELEIVSQLIEMQRRLFGVTMKELRQFVFQLAVKNNCKHPFNTKTQMAGEDWAYHFMQRHPEISLRKPEATSGARAMGFNKVAVTAFFELLTKTVDEYKLTGDRIYNCDETGITVNPKQMSKVVASKGQRQVGALTSTERGNTVTAEICVSASGAYMPPMLIFPRKRKRREFEEGLPVGGWAETHDTGWMTIEIFEKWFTKFIEFSKATKDKPVLLILDGHVSHTKNLKVIEMARNNGVIMLCFPPHCSHRLQPLDVSFMKPLSLYYEEETRKWLRTNAGRIITLYDISKLFGQAFLRAANMRTAVNGFEKTGIWPVDKSVFTEVDFLPSMTTDIELVTTQSMVASTISAETVSSQKQPPDHVPESGDGILQDITNLRSQNESENEPRAGCSWMPDSPVRKSVSSSFIHASPKDIMPCPKVPAGKKRVTRKRGKTSILTASPYKLELEEALRKAENVKKAKVDRITKKVLSDRSKDTKKKAAKSAKGKSSKKKELSLESSDDGKEDEDTKCLYCNERYSKSIEGWCSCQSCKKWAHMSCAGLDSDDDDSVLICEFCDQ